MAPKKKTKETLKPSPPVKRAAALASVLNENKNEATACLASNVMKEWRYIDFIDPHTRLPCLALEWLYGARGLLAGRILQLRAVYSKGKTSFMYLMYAAAQLLSDAYCYHVETEGTAAPPDFVEGFGCDPENLVIDEISSLEECLAKLDEIIARIRGGFQGGINPETGRKAKTKFTDPLDPNMEAPIVAGIDSLSALGLMNLVGEDIADMSASPSLAAHARKLRDYLRRRSVRFKNTQTLLMLTSHETSHIQAGPAAFGGGGKKKSALAQEAIGIHATYIADMSTAKYIDKSSGARLGDVVTMSTDKNKLSPKNRQVNLYLVWNHGFDLI